jgi:hypothetical protein
MRRLACLVGCNLVAGVALNVAPAGAAPRALLDAPRAEDVAVAGGEVMVAAITTRGAARLTAVPVAGGPPRFVLHAGAPERGGEALTVRLVSSAQLTALLVEFTDREGDSRFWHVFAGPPSGPLAIVHRARLEGQPRAFWVPFELDVHGDRLLIHELRFPLREGGRARIASRVIVHAPGMAPTRVWHAFAGGPTAVAGDRIAYFSGRSRPLIRVVDWRTGRLAGTVGLGRFEEASSDRPLDFADDSRVVVELDRELFAGTPGQRARPLHGTRAAGDLSEPRIAGERVVALGEARLDAERPLAIDPRTRTLRAVGPPSTAVDALTADETTLAWLANGCVLAAGVADLAPLEVVPPGPCPRAEVVLEQHDQRRRGRALRVEVGCVTAPPSGCRGRVVLGASGGAGSGRFRVPAGRSRVVTVRLTRSGVAAVRRRLRSSSIAVLRMDARVVDGAVSRDASLRSVLAGRRG